QQQLLSRIQIEFGETPGYVFIDEIQQKTNAGKFLKGIYDMNTPYKFVVTGSGSLELKEKIGESLMGRKQLIEMYTVSFYEFLDYKTKYKYSNRLDKYCALEIDQVQLYLDEYMSFGSYPKVITTDGRVQKREVMNEIYNSYLTRDISYLLGVRSTDKFTKLIKLLAVQSGNILNYSQLATDCQLNVDTLKNYLWYAQQTYVIKEIPPYFSNAKKEITKSPSIYFNDLGMCNFGRNTYGIDSSGSNGFIFQNFVFQALRDKYRMGINPINFWRTKDKAEVDFIVHTDGDIIPIEVKHSQLLKATVSRSYRSYINRYKPKTGYIVNLSLDTEITIATTKVKFIPYWKLIV
nr:ATP-binding protein [Bacteroidales bacterium]